MKSPIEQEKEIIIGILTDHRYNCCHEVNAGKCTQCDGCDHLDRLLKRITLSRLQTLKDFRDSLPAEKETVDHEVNVVEEPEVAFVDLRNHGFNSCLRTITQTLDSMIGEV